MMSGRMALCVDEVSSRSPELIGLEGEVLDAQEWLVVFTAGHEARVGIAGRADIEETWVVSCDDVEPINLAAAIKADEPSRRVCLVTGEACGSLFSRAHTAQIDEVLDLGAFLHRYAEFKRAASGRPAVSPEAERSVAPVAPVAQAASAVQIAPTDGAAVLERTEVVVAPQRFASFEPQPQPRPQALVLATGSRAFVLTVVSGSGGAGKSSVAALSAVVAQKMGFRTLLLDCDLQFGDVAGMVGEDNPVCLDEVLMRPDRLESDVVREGALSVLAAPSRLEAGEEVVKELPGLLEHLSGLFDVIVVNTGASWAEQHAVLLERSSTALFLIDQRVSSVNACRHALELCARCGIAANPFQFALNRCAKGAPLTSIDASCALQGASVYELKDGGRDVEDYLSAGGAAELLEMKNEFAKSVETVMDRVLPSSGRRLLEPTIEIDERRSTRKRARRVSRKRGER